MKEPEILADKLKLYREFYGLTQSEIAEVLGIDRSAYSYYELGQSTPSMPSLIKLALMYHVPTDDLFGMSSGNIKGTMKVKAMPLNKNEKMVILRFRLLEKNEQEKIMAFLSDLCNDDRWNIK